MIDNLLIAVHDFARHMLTSLSIDEILLPRYENLSTNFRGLLLKGEMALSHLKHMNSVLFLSCEDQCLLLLALGYAVGIQLGQVHLKEALDHQHSLHVLYCLHLTFLCKAIFFY